MDRQLQYSNSTARSDLESMLSHIEEDAMDLPLSLLEEITNGFSDAQEIGRGGFAVVYKGMLKEGLNIAVKKLSNTYMYEKEFLREIECLMKVKHENVVRFLGYCVNTQGKAESYGGKFVMADVQQRLLCFEYLPDGSLDRHITDASIGLDWRRRYKIIHGICHGLHYLHQNHIIHLDLKPQNILLDSNMIPKIADFGMSRSFSEKQSRTFATKRGGTMGYIAPESFDSCEITYRLDLFSLGVIITEIITGKKGHPNVRNVLEIWSNRMEKSQRDIQLEQIRLCADIGIQCTDRNPEKRPVSTQEIIDRIQKMYCTDSSTETSLARSPALQAETTSCMKHPGALKVPEERSSEVETTSSVEHPGALKVLEERSYVVESASSVEHPALQVETGSSVEHPGALKVPEETSYKEFAFSGSSIFLLDRTMAVLIPEAVHVAMTKIGTILGNEAALAVIAKICEKVNNLKEFPKEYGERRIQICQKVNILKEFPKKFEQIRIRLTTTSAVISQTGTAKGMKSWIRHVRKMSHRVEDVLDKYLYHIVKIQCDGAMSLRRFFTDYVEVFSEIVDEVAEVEEEIQQVLQLKGQLLQPSEFVPNQLIEVKRHKTQYITREIVKGEDLTGIEDNRILLARWLDSDDQHGKLITVFGKGGLGKTTLVNNVYEREKIMFDAHAWIIVSKNYNLVDLLWTILTKIGYMAHEQSVYMDADDLNEEIKRLLKSRKCLIVLDDVWDRDIYSEMHEVFENLNESRIIITTRNKHVASLALPTRQLELQPLGKANALELFHRMALYNWRSNSHWMYKKFPTELMKIANSIIDMCQGLPAAILSVGGMLSSKQLTERAWNKTYNQLRSELAKNDNIQAILYVSYCDLPGDLRNCFLYCSLFAESYPVPRESLVRLWVAEGFAVGEGHRTPEDVAEGHLMELIHRNMLEVVEYDELGKVSMCKMHGMIRDLALYVAKEEKFGSANDSGTMLLMDKEIRRLSTSEWEDDTKSRVKFVHLRTMMSPATASSSKGMLSSILLHSSYLTVLELQDSEITELPASIGNLFNLHYIGLRRTRIKSIPESIENLRNLGTLDIKQTKIEKLPRGISKVKKLMHLLADRLADEKKSDFRYLFGVQAPTELSNLEELQTLETVQASKDLTAELKKLTKLQSLGIDNISAGDSANLFATLSNMTLLSSLVLSASDEDERLFFETLQPTSTRLHKLIIRGRCANGTLQYPIFQDHGRNLRYLALSWCQLSEDPLLKLALYTPNLTYLSLNRVNTTDTLVLSAGCFPKLKILVLKNMPDVNQLTMEEDAIRLIECLYILSLSGLDRLPAGIGSLTDLKKLWIIQLHMDFKTNWYKTEMHIKTKHIPELRITAPKSGRSTMFI